MTKRVPTGIKRAETKNPGKPCNELDKFKTNGRSYRRFKKPGKHIPEDLKNLTNLISKGYEHTRLRRSCVGRSWATFAKDFYNECKRLSWKKVHMQVRTKLTHASEDGLISDQEKTATQFQWFQWRNYTVPMKKKACFISSALRFSKIMFKRS